MRSDDGRRRRSLVRLGVYGPPWVFGRGQVRGHNSLGGLGACHNNYHGALGFRTASLVLLSYYL